MWPPEEHESTSRTHIQVRYYPYKWPPNRLREHQNSKLVTIYSHPVDSSFPFPVDADTLKTNMPMTHCQSYFDSFMID
jgi:hypothetical protein